MASGLGEVVFLKGVAPSRSSKLQWMASHTYVYMGSRNWISWVIYKTWRTWNWERLECRGKYRGLRSKSKVNMIKVYCMCIWYSQRINKNYSSNHNLFWSLYFKHMHLCTHSTYKDVQSKATLNKRLQYTFNYPYKLFYKHGKEYSIIGKNVWQYHSKNLSFRKCSLKKGDKVYLQSPLFHAY